MTDRHEQDRERNRQDLEGRSAKNSMKGTGNDMKGRMKDAAGGLTGDSEMQAEGKMDRLKGKAQDTLSNIQRKVADSDRKR